MTKPPSTMSVHQRTPENLSLNVIRSAAALLVVAEHVRALFFLDWQDATHGPVSQVFYFVTGLGSTSVLVFFVLSGFWVGGSVIRATKQSTFSWRSYLLRRGVRLWVVLVPATGVALIAGWVLLKLFPLTAIAQGDPNFHVVTPALPSTLTVTTWLGNILFLQGIIVPAIGTDGALWSLAYEFWYYILFPLGVLTLRRGTLGSRLITGTLAIAVAVLVGPPVLILFPVWLLGAALSAVRPIVQPWIATSALRRRTFPLIGIGVLCTAIVIKETILSKGVIGEYVVAFGTAGAIVGLFNDVNMSGALWAPVRGLARYAQSSYSLYVVHLPIALIAAAIFIGRPSSRELLTPSTFTTFMIVVALLAGIGWIFATVTEHRTDTVRKLVDRGLKTITAHGLLLTRKNGS